MSPHPVLQAVAARIAERSADRRAGYLARVAEMTAQGPARGRASCANIAHAIAASGEDKEALKGAAWPNLAIVTAYNDMLSAHQPYGRYPDLIKAAAREAVATAQIAGGIPAMCDGVTQGESGMELSLFSRDVIAMATAVALSHNMFNAALLLGVCDKIVPGLFIGAASFGHMPAIFVPAGPMPTGLSNAKKAEARAAHARGEAGRDTLLLAETASYHSPGTCTFYGTANTNQMVIEAMGLMLPGAAFVQPGDALRDPLTRAAAQRAAALARSGAGSLAAIADERVFVNAVAALCATGGSTNHTLHLVAMARACGLILTWDDIADVSAVTPLLARVYPNGAADVNHFHAAGGTGFVLHELLKAGLVFGDVETVSGRGLARQTQVPALRDGALVWLDGPEASGDRDVLRPADDPFDAEGGVRLLDGNLGRAVMKISAVAPQHRVVEAPAVVFGDQADFLAAFEAGQLNRDVVAVVRFQGPRANGMPELHRLSPALSVLQDRGFKVALVTDGRMSGASGKTPAAIHLTPEATAGGPVARLRDGDVIRVDGETGRLEVKVEPSAFAARSLARAREHPETFGRNLFAGFRRAVSGAECGGSVFPPPCPSDHGGGV